MSGSLQNTGAMGKTPRSGLYLHAVLHYCAQYPQSYLQLTAAAQRQEGSFSTLSNLHFLLI